ncbi:hypothetical protein PTTG_29608 [Puccinia triticina 1-1 BBBD Race 1]|uniref:Phosphoribulokinase/uridine kinase domain-containing protein n=1 Tax=Puccinia triticina (isolate 1-1 / race 1 (BBBD)) TaxID=630390 RepID=A0A180G2V8_PUCT1|nr:hypothetical protein PTTG_29608 [Puccinia triticina 1-1 BBBD Race 1]
MDIQLAATSAAITAAADRHFQEASLSGHHQEYTDRVCRRGRFLVGIAGRPGSGKTTVARALCVLINRHYRASEPAAEDADVAVVVGLDGWSARPAHSLSTAVLTPDSSGPSVASSRAVLDRFDDPAEAHRRRGAAWTFDAAGYRAFVERLLREEGELAAPTFSHTTKDPVAGGLSVLPRHKIVLLEGLYTLLEHGAHWAAAARLVHLPILVAVGPETAQLRLVRRHLRAGIVADPRQAIHRVAANDLPNGEYLLANSRQPALLITSIDDPALAAPDEAP